MVEAAVAVGVEAVEAAAAAAAAVEVEVEAVRKQRWTVQSVPCSLLSSQKRGY